MRETWKRWEKVVEIVDIDVGYVTAYTIHLFI
jgi:hypothetical protein